MKFEEPQLRIIELLNSSSAISTSNIPTGGEGDENGNQAPARHAAPTTVNGVLSGVADQK